MSTADELLARVRDHKPTKRGTKKVFERPERMHFMQGYGLCFDQTLSKTGWSVLEISSLGIVVWNSGMIKPVAVKGSYTNEFERTFDKARQIEEGVTRLLHSAAGGRADFLVHEMPSVAGYRLESSLMAAWIIRQQVKEIRPDLPVFMYSRRSAYSALVGGSDAKKAEGTATVERLIHSRNLKDPWNQDVHDSVLLGLKHLHTPEESR